MHELPSKHENNVPRIATRRAGLAAGAGATGLGLVFASTGIADFFTSGAVSSALSNIGHSDLPELVRYPFRHVAEMPLILKTGGGASLISTGQGAIRKFSRK